MIDAQVKAQAKADQAWKMLELYSEVIEHVAENGPEGFPPQLIKMVFGVVAGELLLRKAVVIETETQKDDPPAAK